MPITIVPDPDRDLGEQLHEVFTKIKAEFHHLVSWFPRPDTPHGGVISIPTDEETVGVPTAPVAGTNFASAPDQTPAGDGPTDGNQSAAPAGPAAPATEDPSGDPPPPAAPEDDQTPPPVIPETEPAAPAAPAAPAPATAPAPAPAAAPAAPAAPAQATSGPRTARRDAGRKAVPVTPEPAQETKA